MRIFSLLGFVASVAAELITTGASVKLGGIDYYICPYSQGKILDGAVPVSGVPTAFGFTPVTVVSDHNVSPNSLESLFGSWATKDDVFQPAFLSTVLLAEYNTSGGDKTSYFYEGVKSQVIAFAGSSQIPSGPYFLEVASGNIHPAYRLYSDFGGSFTESLLQTPAGTFQALSAQISSSNTPTIGVPSRLYYTPTSQKPLAGVRVGVKDIFSLAGQRKSCGNRAWWHLYPEANQTAPAIQNLIDAGAIIVGYQKTSQFANGELPTADWVSQLAPFNPRGDGYNDPSSSSSGAGASIASYPWLDLAVGSDTGGSIRGPANQQGLFGNRPSRGLVTLDLAMPLSPTLDTPGFLTRDPAIWDAASKAMYGANYTSLVGKKPKYPKVIYAMGFPNSSTDAGRILNNFTAAVAAFTGATLTPFNITTAWASTRPSSAPTDPLTIMLNTTYATLIAKEQVKLVRDPFYADYAAAHNGRRPFINPVPLLRWGWGDSVPNSWHSDAIRNKTIFMQWFNSNVLPRAADKTQCTDKILLYAGSIGTASPRNRYGPMPGPPFGFSSSDISIFSEVPDSVWPLGEVAVPSSVTGENEPLPVTISILVAKGCDGVIAKLTQDLVDAGILKVPKTGGSLAGSEVLFKRKPE